MLLVVGGGVVCVGEGDLGGVGVGVGAGVGSRGTQARDGRVGDSWWEACGGLDVCGDGVVVRVVVVMAGVGSGGAVGVEELREVVWLWVIVSASSKTRTRLLIVWRTLLMSRLLVGRVDTSFKVDLRRWRELEAMRSQLSYGGVTS